MAITFWKDEGKRVIDPKLFSEHAENLAIGIAKEAERNRRVNRRTQVRKFYDEVLRLDSLAQSFPDDWDNILPYVHMLTAKAAYARGRDLVSEQFVSFIKDSIGQIKQTNDLKLFSDFFEAFMGFYRKHGPAN